MFCISRDNTNMLWQRPTYLRSVGYYQIWAHILALANDKQL